MPETQNFSQEPINNLVENNNNVGIVNINYPDIIRKALKAEEQRNFDEIYSYYSPYMRRYWDIYYPDYKTLKKSYEYVWDFTSYSYNEVNKIVRVNTNTFDLYTQFTYFDNNKLQSFKTKSIIRYVFDNNGKIKEIYGIEQNLQPAESEETNNSDSRELEVTETNKKEENNIITSESINSEPPNDLYYLFRTKFDNPPFEIPLRNSPSIGGIELYKCPKNASVYVIDNSKSTYYKVYVNGYTGYVTKNYLVRKY